MASSAQQVLFLNKNAADWTNPLVVVSATEASSLAPNLQDRSNLTGWMTTGSVDANNTTITCDFGDLETLTDVILINHNFASFTVQYWNGSAYVDFSTPINVTGCTDSSSGYSFVSVNCTKIQIVIRGTQVPNTDKRMTQLIAANRIGQLFGWPVINSPSFDYNLRNNTMLSGKANIGANLGGFSCTLSVSNWSNGNDLSIVENLYTLGAPFLVWLCGGSEAQFSSTRMGYRKQDIFFAKCSNTFQPQWADGMYKSGLQVDIDLQEVSN